MTYKFFLKQEDGLSYKIHCFIFGAAPGVWSIVRHRGYDFDYTSMEDNEATIVIVGRGYGD